MTRFQIPLFTAGNGWAAPRLLIAVVSLVVFLAAPVAADNTPPRPARELPPGGPSTPPPPPPFEVWHVPGQQMHDGVPAQVRRISPEVLQDMPPELRAMFERGIGTIEEDPYWEETVNRALAELESDSPETRRSAVMLLGKYSVPPARQAVIESLEDPNSGVRMAALVSLFENPQMYPRETVMKILPLVGDPDVSIRRIATNLLPTLVHSFPVAGGGPFGGAHGRHFPREIEQVLRAAYRDDDAIVRRNMVAHHTQIRIPLPSELVVQLLLDEDDQVAIQTVGWGLRELSGSHLDRIAGPVVAHPSEIFRREVARHLQFYRGPGADGILDALRSDDSPPVALEAGLALFQRQPDTASYRQLKELFDRAGRPPEIAQRLISSTQFLGAEGEPLLREWLQASDPSQRQVAASQYLNLFGDRADDELIRTLLADHAQPVRDQATIFLLRNPDRLNEELVRAVATSRHRDVRRRAANLAGALSPTEAHDLLMDLLLDNATEVRVTAIQEIGRRRIDGWEEIMAMSLMDDEPGIQMHAAEWLLRHPPSAKVLDLLRDYVDRNPSSPLRQRIHQHLQRHGSQERT